MINDIRITFSVGDTTSGLQLVVSKTGRIGDIKYNIWFCHLELFVR